MKPNWIGIGALSGALAVLLGAFGTHGLKDKVSFGELEIWRTGVLYQAIHALALVLFGLLREIRSRSMRPIGSGPGWAFAAGTLLFSGTLYVIAVGGPHVLGAVAPVGGLLLISGWLGFAIQALRSPGASESAPKDGSGNPPGTRGES